MIQTVKQRAALKPRDEPYFVNVSRGRYLGFRKSETIGTWVAKAYDSREKKKTKKSLGDLGHLPAADQYSAALKLAQEWFAHLDGGGSTERINVAEACARYVRFLAERGRRNDAKASKGAEGWFATYVLGEPIAAIRLDQLREDDCAKWVSAFKTGNNTRGRAKNKSTVNRGIAMLRSALNLALRRRAVTSSNAWRVELAAMPGVTNARKRYLTKEERRALLAHMSPEALPFYRALCLMPVRPGALAAANVGDFDSKTGAFLVREDKAGEGRTIILPPVSAELFREQCRRSVPVSGNVSRQKVATDPIFARADGSRWDWNAWIYPLRAAVKAAGVDPATTSYAFRHATITDLIHNGLDIFTIAKLAGTSVLMIEKHYGKVSSERIQAALASLVA